jgi:hypothetical protein
MTLVALVGCDKLAESGEVSRETLDASAGTPVEQTQRNADRMIRQNIPRENNRQ